MVFGIFLVGVFYFVAVRLGWTTLHWVLSHFFQYSVLIAIILFQDEIRRGLAQVGKNPFFFSQKGSEDQGTVDEVVRAATRLASNGIGALIAIERETGLKNFTDTGSVIESKVNTELIQSIFLPASGLHDGAIIIKEGRIRAAGCFLPLSKNPNLDRSYGTRHRAAIGLTEDTDALVIVVSEETCAAHFVIRGKVFRGLTEEGLKTMLTEALGLPPSFGAPFRKNDWTEERGQS